MNLTDLEVRFNKHDLSNDQSVFIDMLRNEFLFTAEYVEHVVPVGREKALALTKLEEALFWANAGIARANVQ